MLSLLALSVPVEYFDNIKSSWEVPRTINCHTNCTHGQASVECGLIIWFSSWTKMMIQLWLGELSKIISKHTRFNRIHVLKTRKWFFHSRVLGGHTIFNWKTERLKKDETKEQLTCFDKQLFGLRVQSESIEKTIFSLDQMFEEKVRKGERLNQNLLITDGIAL